MSPSVLPLPPDWYPESLAVTSDGVFYVGSWRHGAIARISAPDWTPQIIVAPGSQGLANVQGVMIDEPRGLLWVCSSDYGLTTVPVTPSALKSFDLDSGRARSSYPWPGGGHCNDLILCPDGTILVTDTKKPRILQLRPGARALEDWLEHPSLGGGGPLCLNGIAMDDSGDVIVAPFHPVDYLLRVRRRSDGSAGAVERLFVPRTLRNADAIRWLGDEQVLICESDVSGGGAHGGSVTVATIDEGRIVSLRTIANGLVDPASAVVFRDRAYYVETKYRLLMDHRHDPGAIVSDVPFCIQSTLLSEGNAMRRQGEWPDRQNVAGEDRA